mgnify:CR=1 FL=1
MGTSWDNNALWFPRLIAAADKAGCFSGKKLRDVCCEMRLQPEDVRQLIDRARKEADRTNVDKT